MKFWLAHKLNIFILIEFHHSNDSNLLNYGSDPDNLRFALRQDKNFLDISFNCSSSNYTSL